MLKSEQINELAAALAKAQGQIEGAKKSSSNPFFKSKYADLAECWNTCREALKLQMEYQLSRCRKKSMRTED